MAKKPAKTAAAKAANIDMAAIVAATQTGSFVHVDKDAAASYVADGMIEINETITDAKGNVAARATQKGIESTMNTNTTAPTTAAPTAFAVETAPLSIFTAKRRSNGRSDKYPFDALAAPVEGQAPSAFFVPATEQTPEPWISLGSTVSAASRRYARVVGQTEYTNKAGEAKTRDTLEYDRKFRIVQGERDGVKGAWIGRVV